MVAKKGSPLLPTPASLKGKRVGVQQGTIQEGYAKAYWAPKGVNVVPYPNQDVLYQDMVSGRLDATLQDAIMVDAGFLKSAKGKGFAFAGNNVVDAKTLGVGAAIGLRKEDADLKKNIDKALQLGLNSITESIHMEQIDINPFVAGVITLAFIYGAYFTETFRGAFQAVPKGQLEAAYAYGMTPFQVFRRVLFPQMMRFALPGIGNNWQVLIKATALVSLIGLTDIVKITQDAGRSSMQVFYFSIVAAVIYLAITTLSNLILMWLERRYSAGVKKGQL
ncbi:hypothetical protein LTR94_023987 [Friedmanniomyces endolithicus]|nr:hypothetical protein LTR94_023987 [Friedmanniomyces endolithicus]